MGFRAFIALALATFPLVTACSSDPTGAPSTADSGTTSDGAVDAAATQDSSASVDGTTTSTDASTDSAASGPYACSYSLSGALNEPTTDAPAACANGKVEQPNGAGDYTASFGGGFQTSAETVILSCTISSSTPPAAGSTWALEMDDHAQGNCQITLVANSQGSSWIASSNAASITGSASITFQSAAIAHGAAHPTDVYYTYDLVLDATLKAQGAGGADITVHGRFVQTQLPLGN